MAARGTHVMDAMISIAGAVEKISCISERRVLDVDLDDTTSMLMKFKVEYQDILDNLRNS